ncbi:YihY/virulence factor BrkB family protein [Nocardioides sp.]|uniref:YihY/virulence factor BrkB family protein n=1 Tax=Nocardioides sp. TaxID=35761 RepID=UPI002ECFCBCD
MGPDPVRGLGRHKSQTPAPDDPIKSDSPTDLTGRSWWYIARKTVREFLDDECPDLAAALTYYAVLAIFPAAVALVSLLGVAVDPEQAVQTALDVLRPLVSPDVLGSVEPALTDIAESDAAGWALVLGLAGAVWTASGYVGAFGRAMNRVYEIDEGRPFWKLRPVMMLITLFAVVMCALVLLMLVVSGPLAESVGSVLGVGDEVVLLWNIVKWPLIGLFVVVIVAVLYYATPNVQQPRFRWLSVGAVVAIVGWLLASVGFAFYIANFASYNKTYGSLAGVIVGLLFLWITNLALLFGAELDSEMERGRQLQAGIPAEAELQLPAKDTRNIEKAKEREAEDIRRGREVRQQADRPTEDSQPEKREKSR